MQTSMTVSDGKEIKSAIDAILIMYEKVGDNFETQAEQHGKHAK